jgi:hypothetical protein
VASVEDLLKAANSRLKYANTGIILFKRGNKLSLRGMLPAKPGSGKYGAAAFGCESSYPKRAASIQQTIALDLYANAAEAKVAESEALKVSGLIALKQFDWGDYLKTANATIGSAGYWIDKFEFDYFNKRDRNPKTETTWKDYCKVFNKFDRDARLDHASLLRVVLSTKPDSRSRKRACTYTKKLGLFASIDFDPSDYKGNYSADSVDIRNIPSDADIQRWRDKMPSNYGLKYAFGRRVLGVNLHIVPLWYTQKPPQLMAAYGLRNYELFHIDLESIKKPPGHLRIVESKRNKKTERLIWCLYPEWYEAWSLGNIDQPFPTVGF